MPMIDFLRIATRTGKHGVIEVYPNFIITKSKDLMIRGSVSMRSGWKNAACGVPKSRMRCSSLTVNLIFMQTSISSFWAIMFESYICGMHSLA